MKYPNTLLTRFYGMHRVKPHKKKEVHFLIMGSVFYTQRFIHRTFDLKVLLSMLPHDSLYLFTFGGFPAERRPRPQLLSRLTLHLLLLLQGSRQGRNATAKEKMLPSCVYKVLLICCVAYPVLAAVLKLASMKCFRTMTSSR